MKTQFLTITMGLVLSIYAQAGGVQTACIHPNHSGDEGRLIFPRIEQEDEQSLEKLILDEEVKNIKVKGLIVGGKVQKLSISDSKNADRAATFEGSAAIAQVYLSNPGVYGAILCGPKNKILNSNEARIYSEYVQAHFEYNKLINDTFEKFWLTVGSSDMTVNKDALLNVVEEVFVTKNPKPIQDIVDRMMGASTREELKKNFSRLPLHYMRLLSQAKP